MLQENKERKERSRDDCDGVESLHHNGEMVGEIGLLGNGKVTLAAPRGSVQEAT